MATIRAWSDYSPTYRAAQMRTLARWIAAGHSGSVVGTGGAGKSNLLGYLTHRPDALASYLPEGTKALCVMVDLNSLPSKDMATVFRLVIRCFHAARGQLDADLADEIDAVFQAQIAQQDAFVVQTALFDWLSHVTRAGYRVALVMDRFDRIADRSIPELVDGLRAFRDAFKGRFCCIVGMRMPASYLPDPTVLGEMHELLDTRICWVGPMNDADARNMIAEETANASPAPRDEDVAALLELTGGYPAFLKAACTWWMELGHDIPRIEWEPLLAEQRAVRSRLDELWEGLTRAEQDALGWIASADKASLSMKRSIVSEHRESIELLRAKSLIESEPDGGWWIRGSLLAGRAGAQGQRRGCLRMDPRTKEFFLGSVPLSDLTNLERAAITFLLVRPRVRVPKSELVEAMWPEDVVDNGIMDDALYQVIRGLRKKIEPEPSRPRYLITWRGRPEGGYQLFPEGRPAN